MESEPSKYNVMGIIKLEAIPQEEKYIPFDKVDNPIPLVKFIDVERKN